VSGGQVQARFMLRVEGLSQSKGFEGGQASAALHWLHAGGRLLRADYLGHSYIATPWIYRDLLLAVPAEATGVRFVVEARVSDQVKVPSTIWFDDAAVCAYAAPAPDFGGPVIREWSVTAGREILRLGETPAWFYPAGSEGSERVQAIRERDAAALLGAALRAPAGVPKGMVYHTAYTTEQPPGLYRAVFRVRRGVVAKLPPADPLLSVDIISSSMGSRGGRTVTVAEAAEWTGYQDVTIDFIKPATGWLALRVSTPGTAEFWLDHVRVVELVRFRDPDLVDWYPGLTGALAGELQLAAVPPYRVLLVVGLLGDAYHLDSVLNGRKNVEVTRRFTQMNMAGGAVPDYPETWDDLARFQLVILANASLEALGPDQRHQLRRFVETGGSLLVLGGKSAFGNGGIRGSFLEPIFPLTVADSRFDLAPAAAPRLKVTPAGRKLGLRLPGTAVSPLLHKVSVGPNASVAVQAGDAPFLVLGTAAAGRIACLCGSPLGRPAAGDVLFTEVAEYPTFLDALLMWLQER
jgi:uncharacterized membrane protein